MARPEKVEAVAEIKDRISGAQAVFVAEYSGLSVGDQQKLRRGLTAADGEFKVVKMTLARRAASELGHDGLLEMLVGPTGLAFASGDAAATAKVLRDFSKDHATLVVKGGLLGAEVLPPERVAQLADIEPRDVLLAKLAGAFQAPMATMARLLAAMPRAMATMIQQLIDRAPVAADDEPAAAPEQSVEAEASVEAEPEATPEQSVEAEPATEPEAEASVEAEPEAAPEQSAEAEPAAEPEAEASVETEPEAAPEKVEDDDAADTAEEE